MLDSLAHFLSESSALLWGSVLFILLLGTHLYLTIILRFPQRYLFKGLACYFSRAKDSEGGHITPFASLTISLAANIGTGNIIGVATALAAGGPGAIFWCWMTGILGISTRYAESLISSRYRVKDEAGNIVGGPMYALDRGLKMKWLGCIFAILTAIAAFGIGNITQGNAAAAVLNTCALQIPSWLTGLVLVVLVGSVLLGGLNSISKLCKACVPTMALIYIVGCLLVLISQAHSIIPAIELIITSAFTPQAATGGFIGSTIIIAMQTGVQRGLFSNEAGMGSSPIIAAPAKTPNCVKQALISSTGPFWDTVIICTLTGITLTTCIIAQPSIGNHDATVMTFHSFGTVGVWGSTLLTISLLTFVISTLLGWSYFGERALQYLGGVRFIIPYRILWVVATFVGCVIPKSSIVWDFADCANGLMAVPNVICMIAMSGLLIRHTRHYLWENRLDEKDECPIPNKDEPDCVRAIEKKQS